MVRFSKNNGQRFKTGGYRGGAWLGSPGAGSWSRARLPCRAMAWVSPRCSLSCSSSSCTDRRTKISTNSGGVMS